MAAFFNWVDRVPNFLPEYFTHGFSLLILLANC